MPKTNDKLYRLINALTDTELRTYRKLCHKEHPQQSKQFLFILDSYIKYSNDQDKLSKKIESITHHYVYKHNLYNSLLNYVSGEKISTLNEVVLKLSWLYSKGLIEDALELSNESLSEWAPKITGAFNTNYLRLIHYNILFKTSLIESFEDPKELLAPYDKIIGMLDSNLLSFKYQKVYYRLFYLSNNPYLNDEIKNELKEIFSDKIFLDESQAQTLEAKRYYHRIFHMKSYLELDAPNMLKHSRALVALWEDQKDKNSFNYIIECFNYLESCFTVNDFNNDFYEILYAFINTIKKSPVKNIEIEYAEYIISIKLYNKIGNSNEASKIVEYALQNENIKSLSTDKILKLKYNAFITYFLLKDFKKTGLFLDEIIGNSKAGFSVELIAFSRLLQEIIICETGKYDYLAFSIDSAKRYFNRNDSFLAIIKTTIKYLKEVAGQFTARERKKVFAEFKETIETQHSSFEINRVSNGFDLISWIESQINEIPMSEIVKNKFITQYPVQAPKIIDFSNSLATTTNPQ